MSLAIASLPAIRFRHLPGRKRCRCRLRRRIQCPGVVPVCDLDVPTHRCRTNERGFQILNNVIPVRWLRVLGPCFVARRPRPGAA
ncbi:hypothetical protein MTP99_011249 [Tenebrio molitor]|uniref:Uncharacterized protein n=1 Tax=Tenebrio molitor TaxID=7067 RepID=A0A8J6HRN7_TENMO|nr:hypothetical protein GEV33_004035 [Tenebrio molitor]KAJ3634367.1 hypothetical protein MTP99_011249 [Tenebrio molitor]